MKKTLILAVVVFSMTANAQFHTTYNQNGDPLTEIIDESAMRQGNWSYFDHLDQLIRSEKYENHVLLERTHLVDGKKIPTEKYSETKLTANSQLQVRYNEMQKDCSGEVLVDKNGTILLVSFYRLPNPEKLNEYTHLLHELVSNNNLGTSSTILLF